MSIIMKKLFFSFIAVSLVFFSIEGLLYLIGFEPRYQEPFILFVGNPERKLAEENKNYDGKDDIIFTTDDVLFWKFKPSSTIDINPNYKLGDFYSRYTINSYGFRGKEFRKEKERDTYRIIIIGNSISFGLMVPEEKTYYKLLEKMLRESFPQIKFEVLSAGIPGYTSFQGLQLLKKEILSYSPDMVIVYFGAHNEFARGFYTDREYADKIKSSLLERWSKTIRTLGLMKLLSQTVGGKMVVQGGDTNMKSNRTNIRVPPITFLDDIMRMRDLSSESGVDIVFVAPPYSDIKLKEEPIAEEYTSIVKFLGNYIVVADVDSQFKLKGADSLFTRDNAHPNEKGHEVIAETLVNVVKRRISDFFVKPIDILNKHSFSKENVNRAIMMFYDRLVSEAVLQYGSNGGSNKYTIEPYNIKVIDGYSGKSPYFNGSDSYIATSLSFANMTGFSTAFWVKPDRQQTGKIVTIFDNGHDAMQDCALQSDDIVNSTYTFHCFGVNAIFELPPDKWTHVLLTVNLENRVLQVYINGKKQIIIWLHRDLKFGNTLLTFGKLAKLNDRYFKGTLSKIIVWDRPLLEEDVKVLAFGLSLNGINKQ